MAAIPVIETFLATLTIIFVVPIIVYGLFVRYFRLPEPAKKISFLLGVLVQKMGAAFAFTMLFYVGRRYFADAWPLYALGWFGMFALSEIGQAIGPGYSKKEAAAGIISEATYFPLSAWIASLLIRP